MVDHLCVLVDLKSVSMALIARNIQFFQKIIQNPIIKPHINGSTGRLVIVVTFTIFCRKFKKISTHLLTVLTISVITDIEQKKRNRKHRNLNHIAKNQEEKMMLIRNNLFDDFFGDMFDDPFFNRGYVPQNQLMKTDIRERDGQYLLEIEVPGYTREDVKAELKDGYLTITADRKEPVEKADERTRYVRKERYYGTMKRTFYVGEDITENEIHAAFKDGILKVIIDKPQPKKIEDGKTIIPIEG